MTIATEHMTSTVTSQIRRAHVPKYYALKEQINRAIESNIYMPGDAIPSEHELTERYSVSRVTVRRAIDELVNEGRLYRIQGKGTYVHEDKISEDLLLLTSCTQDIINLGMTPSRKTISSDVVEADSTRRSALNLGEGERVFRLERIYYANKLPINHTVTYLPHRMFPGIEEIDFSQHSLYQTLRDRYQTDVVEALRTIQAVAARGDIARYLQVDPGSPVLFFSCVTMGEVCGCHLPIETFDCHYRSDKFRFYIRQVADQRG